MDKEKRKTILNRLQAFLKGDSGRDGGTARESVSAVKVGPTGRTKRKASPEKQIPRKRKRVDEPQTCSDEKRSNEAEPLSVSVEEVRKGSMKRKAAGFGDETSRKRKRSRDLKEAKECLAETQRAEFQAKYQQLDRLGGGGFGSVFAGYRKADWLSVAIKHVPRDKITCTHMDQSGKVLSTEVAIMMKLAAQTSGSVGAAAPVSLLDWYDLDQELILVLERPVPCKDLLHYTYHKGGKLREKEAKIIMKQLVDAAKHLENEGIFHRDIKPENILIESSSVVPRVRLIDFGLSCFLNETSSYTDFYGTVRQAPPEWFSQYTYRAGPTTVWQMGVVQFDLLHRWKTLKTRRLLKKSRLRISKKLSEDCKDFLKSCLSRSPEHRPTLEQLQLHPWLR